MMRFWGKGLLKFIIASSALVLGYSYLGSQSKAPEKQALQPPVELKQPIMGDNPSKSSTTTLSEQDESTPSADYKPLRVVCISDTHGLHRNPRLLQVPPGDLLIHAGDMGLEDEDDWETFDEWLGTLPHAHKVVVFGNMDLMGPKAVSKHRGLRNGTLLMDQVVEVEGYKVCGSPWTPKFYGAFQLNTPEAATAHWQSLLPPDTHIDILVTHGPPRGFADETKGRHAGDPALLEAVKQLRHAPLLWVVGHIHESYGQQHMIKQAEGDGSTLLLNAGVAYLAKRVADAVPRVVELPSRKVSFEPLAQQAPVGQVWKAEVGIHG